jgi:hypothetical protein
MRPITMLTPPAELSPPHPADARARTIVAWLAVSWFALLLLAVVALQLPGALPNGGRVAFDRAVFVAVSVGTLTGFETAFARLADFAMAVRVILLALTCSGLMLALFGGGVLLCRLLRSDRTDAFVAVWTLGLIAVAATAGVAAGPSDGLLTGLWRGVAALGNMSASVGPAFDPERAGLWLALYPVSVAGVLGPVALAAICTRTRAGVGVGVFGNDDGHSGRVEAEQPRRGNAPDSSDAANDSTLQESGALPRRDGLPYAPNASSRDRRVMGDESYGARCVKVCAAVFLAAVAVFLLTLLHRPPAADGVVTALRQATSMAFGTHGFGAMLEPLPNWPRETVWLVSALVLIGVGTPAAVGGFGVAWFWTLPHRLQRPAMTYLGAYALVIFFGLYAVARFDPTITGERLITLVVGAATNVGIAHEPVSLTGPALYWLSACMIGGRLLPLFALAGMLRSQSTPRGSL